MDGDGRGGMESDEGDPEALALVALEVRLERLYAALEASDPWVRLEAAATIVDLIQATPGFPPDPPIHRSRKVLRRLESFEHMKDWRDARPDLQVPRVRRRDRPQCGARCRSRGGAPCRAPVVWLPGAASPRARCRMHGGASTGPRTPEGKAAIAASNRHRAALRRVIE